MNKYKFDANMVKDDCIKWINEWFTNNGPNCNAIVGISGGKDSSVVAALCKEALGKDRVIGILMPNFGRNIDYLSDVIENNFISEKWSYALNDNFNEESKDIESFISTLSALNDGYKLCKFLGIKHICVNINESIEALLNAIDVRTELSKQTQINLPPRIRMATLYAIAQSKNGRVANTTNASEAYLGYGTRWGDTVGDFAPLVNLTCTEVVELGKSLGLPGYLVNRIPNDGLCGKSDEESFGFTYAELDSYIRGENVPYDRAASIVAAIDNMHEKSEFKRKPIASFDPKI